MARLIHDREGGKMTRARVFCYLTVILILLLTALLAAAFGFITPDSWKYLHMAQALRQGQGCSLAGEYFAVFPCGYPMAIALSAPSADIGSLLLGSKLANFLLLSGGFLLLADALRNLPVAALVMLNPVTLHLYRHTWSENLFLFACCGTLFCVARLARRARGYGYALLLGLFLLIGCLSRYFFGPFAVVLFLATWLAFGRRVALKSLPAFLVAGSFFLAYHSFNAAVTGYGSGLERIPAPESLAFLSLVFVQALVKNALSVAASFLVFLALSFRALRFAGDSREPADRACLFLLFCGIGYLLVAYGLRVSTQFDLFGSRTLGYGVVFVMAALAGLWLRNRERDRQPVIGLLACGLFSVLLLHGSLLPQALQALRSGTFRAPWEGLADYRIRPATDARVVFVFGAPPLGANMVADVYLYYGEGVKVLAPGMAPYAKRESLPQFLSRVQMHADQRCVLDFTPFPSRAAFDAFLSERFVVDWDFRKSLFAPERVYQPIFDPELRSYLLEVFRPARLVDCRDLLAPTSTAATERAGAGAGR